MFHDSSITPVPTATSSSLFETVTFAKFCEPRHNHPSEKLDPKHVHQGLMTRTNKGSAIYSVLSLRPLLPTTYNISGG